ncbi:ATP-binding protein [Pseudomonas sp. CCOS 191]|uniref:ATP-binding protein n=1 Tax=Pseudomonas sp. CCOS 191 TaxID=1649877 RepID=UPI000624AB2E|nr:ATP-binding protein [Pseudomonas sp. CCOS 191]CRI57151.1 hypothetical protein CCOS191_2615 [Pseudomonas sp. CCOS 191]
MPPAYPIVHLLFSATIADVPVVLPLSGKYRANMEKTTQAEKRSTYSLSISSMPEPMDIKLDVASFTTLYGENGSGKTAMLLALCEGLVTRNRESQIGVLWEDYQGLYLYLGNSLQRRFVHCEFEASFTDNRPDFLAAFYTTSPYERARRTRLRAQGVLDISPKFSQSQEADPMAAFSAYPYLEGREKFVSKTQVEIRLKPTPLVDLIKNYGRWGSKTYNALDPELKVYIQELSRQGSTITKFILSFVVLNAVRSLEEYERYELIDALIKLIKENRPFLDDLLSDDTDQFEQMSIHPLLTPQLRKAWLALQSTRTLFEGLKNWRRTAQLSYLDEKIGGQIRQYEGLLSEVSALGLLQFSFKGLSSGQASMMFLYCSVAKALGEFERNSNADHMLLCLDEGEMFMHPKWQRVYIADLLGFIRQFGGAAKRTHVFISTHSLIVAADTPAERLFDLEQKQITNAFGLTPKQTLTSVFDVNDFTGKFNHQLLRELSDVLNGKVRDRDAFVHARRVANALADDDLKRHVQQQLDIIGRDTDAKA